MTRRERLERKAEKRREWAEGRTSKAQALRSATPDSLRHDWALITQPGHIPERARMIRRDDKAHEHRQMAEHHEQKAAGIESQLERTIFSDDDDATEQLKAKLDQLEAERTQNNTLNKIIRRKPKNEKTPEKVAELVALGLKETTARTIFEPDFCGRVGIPSYVNQNLGGNIKRCRDRIEQIKRQHQRTAEAEQAGGVIVKITETWAVVTFAEKPEYSVIRALKDAGFHWGSGSWHGSANQLPEELKQE